MLDNKKIAFLGDAGIGKTSILNKQIYGSVTNDYHPTVGIDFFVKSVKYNDRNFRYQIWDTSGEKKFSSMIPTYLRISTIIAIIYDITSRSSFMHLNDWLQLALDNNKDSIIFIIGNKSDLEDQRVVSTEEGEQFSKEHNVHFFETSAREDCDLFQRIQSIIENSDKKENQQNSNKNSFLISASGIKNIFFDSNNEIISSSKIVNNKMTELKENEFRFIIGNYEVITNRFLADFISPRVSHLHHLDITIDSICLNDFIQNGIETKKIFDVDLIENFKKISTGHQIEIDFDMSQKLHFLANLLENDEISNKMRKFYKIDYENLKIDECLSLLKFLPNSFEQNELIDFISSKFYSIEKSKLIKLPKSTLYLILSNENLMLNSEDSMMDFINELFSNSENEENDDYDNSISETIFYELIEFAALSSEKIYEFLNLFDPNKITNNLWQKFTELFDSKSLNDGKKCFKKRYYKPNNSQQAAAINQNKFNFKK